METMQQSLPLTWMRLYRFIYSRVQNREEAEDLTQEAYAHVYGAKVGQAGGTGDGGDAGATGGQTAPANVGSDPYLRTVALNLIRDRWRRQRTHGVQIPLEEDLLEGQAGTIGDFEEDGAVQRAWLQELLGRLPDDYRTVLRLRIVEGFSRAETARRMARTPAAIRGLQFRAVQALRDLMVESTKEEKKP